MIKKNKCFLILLITIGNLLLARPLFAQHCNTDSLLVLLKTDPHDTSRLLHLNKIALQLHLDGAGDSAKIFLASAERLATGLSDTRKNIVFYKCVQKQLAVSYNTLGLILEDEGNYPEALQQYQKAFTIYKAINDRKGMGNEYNNTGIVYKKQGDFSNAKKSYEECLKIREGMNDSGNMSKCYQNIANLIVRQGNYPEALKNYLSALKLRESLKDQPGMVASYLSIGNLYHLQRDDDAALSNYSRALKIALSINNNDEVASTYTSFGMLYQAKGKYPEALDYFSNALQFSERKGEKAAIAGAFTNIGSVYLDKAEHEKESPEQRTDLDKALENNLQGLKLKEEIGNHSSLPSSYINTAVVLLFQKKYAEAERYLGKSKLLSMKLGSKEYLRETYKSYAMLDSANGNFKAAYDNHKQFILYRDSIDNEETQKKTIQSQMTYDFEKKEAVVAAEHKKELESQQMLAAEKSRKQRLMLLFVVTGLLLVMIFSGFIFRSLRITRRQKRIIELQRDLVEKQKVEVEQQKSIVEEHQEEIIDSIRYARRIQVALLPSESYIAKNLNRLKKI